MLAIGLALAGCATTPAHELRARAYEPVIQPPPVDQSAFERDFAACAAQVSGDAALFKRHPKPGPPPGDLDPGLGELLIVFGPIWIGEAIAHSSAERAWQEATDREVQEAMASCLKQRGRVVTSWRPVEGDKAGAARLQTPTEPIDRAQLLNEADDWERFANAASDPKERAKFARYAAELYDRLAESVSDPTERTHFLEMAASARRKTEQAAGATQPAPSEVPAPQPTPSASGAWAGGSKPPQ